MDPSKPYSNITCSGNSWAALVIGVGKGRKRGQEEYSDENVEDGEEGGPAGGGGVREVVGKGI